MLAGITLVGVDQWTHDHGRVSDAGHRTILTSNPPPRIKRAQQVRLGLCSENTPPCVKVTQQQHSGEICISIVDQDIESQAFVSAHTCFSESQSWTAMMTELNKMGTQHHSILDPSVLYAATQELSA